MAQYDDRADAAAGLHRIEGAIGLVQTELAALAVPEGNRPRRRALVEHDASDVRAPGVVRGIWATPFRRPFRATA